nr:toprim domain-containing protein [Pseudomonadota bacterium]
MATAEYRDPRAEFATALKAAGLVVEDAPVMDGQIHRVRVEGAKNGTRDGAYVGFMDAKPSGYIKNFKTGHEENWSASYVQWTPQERASAAAQMHAARQQRTDETAAQHRQTAEKVLVKWEGLSDLPPTGQNAYLARKGVEGHGVKFDGERLVVPVRDIDGKLWSVQSIPPEEGAPKMFEKGGRKGANMHVIGEIKSGAEVLVAEGYATGASLHQATGKTVAVAFDAGNLDAVVGAIKQRHPENPIYIMGDDDRTQQPNVGFDKAMAAAQKHQVGVAFPRFQEPGNLSDFNDLHAKEGLGAVKAQAEKATSLSMEQSREPVASLAVTGPVRDSEPIAVREEKAAATKREPSEQLTARDAVVGAAHVAQAAQVAGPVAHVAVQAVGVADAIKVASDVVQGKEVKALDVASAGASVAMTAGAGGPAVQIAAQAVTGLSAVDAAERTMNTVEAQLKEPAPADVKRRKAIEERHEQVLALPPNSLDERSARQVVKQDVAAWNGIDNPGERYEASLAMRSNVESQSTYKAALAQQDPHAAEAVALAYAKEQQLISAKEDRKAADMGASPAKTQANSIEYVFPREIQGLARAVRPLADPEAVPLVLNRHVTPLEDRFNVVPRFARGRDYHFRDQPGKVAFQERWRSMTSTLDTPAVVKAMVDRAQERGWEALRIKGSEEFKRQAWIAASARGIKAIGYEPTDGDRIAVTEERARLGLSPDQTGRTIQRDALQERSHQPKVEVPERSGIGSQSPASRNLSAMQERPTAPLARHPERAAALPAVDPTSIDRAPDPAKTAPPQVEKPIAVPLRSFLTERGVATSEVEATVALASERMPRDRVHVGQLVSHGTDHYEFDKKNETNYYVKLQSPAGEKVVWGVDLRRALEESQVKVGDLIALEHRGNQPVTVLVKDHDASGKVNGEHAQAVTRNTWY